MRHSLCRKSDKRNQKRLKNLGLDLAFGSREYYVPNVTVRPRSEDNTRPETEQHRDHKLCCWETWHRPPTPSLTTESPRHILALPSCKLGVRMLLLETSKEIQHARCLAWWLTESTCYINLNYILYHRTK